MSLIVTRFEIQNSTLALFSLQIHPTGVRGFAISDNPVSFKSVIISRSKRTSDMDDKHRATSLFKRSLRT
jgi:hypothetical protein